MAISFNKRENEKKKLEKRLEKQKRKEARKENGKSGSFEDMIAYVDENGNITDTPPDQQQKKEEVDLESISISTPKKEAIAYYKGRIEFFNESKGFGFVKDLSNVNKYFFHISNAPENIAEGMLVFFDLERGEKGLNAVNIRLEEPTIQEPEAPKEPKATEDDPEQV